MKQITIFLYFTFIIGGIVAQDTDFKTEIETANKQYSDKQFAEAIASYEQILNSGYESATLYFNLGNAYYKSNKLPNAILNYERALLLSPSDEDIKHNLKLTNLYIRDEIDAIPEFFLTQWAKDFYQLAGVDTWAQYSLISFLGFLILLALYFYSKNPGLRKMSFLVSVVVLLLSVIFLYAASQQKKQLTERDYAILMSPSATVKSSPDINSTDLFLLHEGIKLKVEDEHNGWIEIKIADGRVGWIKSGLIEVI